MNIPNDKEFAELIRDEEQHRLESDGREFFLFGRAFLLLFLVVGIVALIYSVYRLCFNSPDVSAERIRSGSSLYPVVFLVLWNLCALSMIRLVSTKLKAIRSSETESGSPTKP